jgi:hypothetical protein
MRGRSKTRSCTRGCLDGKKSGSAGAPLNFGKQAAECDVVYGAILSQTRNPIPLDCHRDRAILRSASPRQPTRTCMKCFAACVRIARRSLPKQTVRTRSVSPSAQVPANRGMPQALPRPR